MMIIPCTFEIFGKAINIVMLSPLLLNCTSSPAITIPPDSWLLVTHSMEHKFPPYLANGYLAATIPPEGTGQTEGKCPPSYISGVYNGALLDPPHLANIPCWSAVVFNNGDADYKKGLGEHLDYTQTLDMRRGLINTEETWIERNKKTDIDITIFISRDKMHLACIRYDVTPHYSGPVSFRTFLDSRDSEDVAQLDQGVDSNKHLFWLVTETLKPEIGWLPKVKIAQASLSVFSKNLLPQIKYHAENKLVEEVLSFEANSSQKYTLYKFIGICSSLEAEDPLKVAIETVEQAKKLGYDKILRDHEKAWARLWESRIVVKGDHELQKVIFSSLFYLMQSLRENRDCSIAPMGLSSNGYNGHIFWDAETWMYPPILLLHPELAKSVVSYRYKTLPGARHKANANGYKGAMYAWESSGTGRETTPTWAATGTYEHHITGDVALAQWQYYCATKDKRWLREYGYPVIKETAEFWVSRVIYDEQKDRYEIHQVIPPDEYHEKVNNSGYTNAVAKRNLEIAVKVSEILKYDYPAEWESIAKKMYIPFDEKKNIHIEFDGYNGSPIKQADIVLLSYPLELDMSNEVRRNDLEYYAARTDPNGPAMTSSIHAILAAQLGQREMLGKYFRDSYQHNINPPFYVWSESPGSSAINSHTGAGGFLQAVINGLAGVRIHQDKLMVNPLLPEGIDGLYIKGIHYGPWVYNLHIRPQRKLSAKKTWKPLWKLMQKIKYAF